MLRNYMAAQGRTQIEKARQIKKSLGTQVAAKFLRNRGWSIEAALYILVYSK